MSSINDQIDELKRLNDSLQGSIKELSFETWKKLQTEQKKYNALLKDTNNLTDEQKKDLEEQVNILKTQSVMAGQFWNKVKSQISDAKDEMHFFLTNTTAQYEYSEQIAKSYLSLNKRIGLTGEKSKAVRDNFKDALPDIRRMGGSAEDLAESYESFAEQSGRQNVLTAENLKNMSSFSLSTGLAVGEASRLYERFTLMGKSIDDSHKMLNDLVNSSNKLGINSTKVLKVLTQNMESMQRMSFKGGVKAMTEMAKLAVKMRMEVSDMLGMADKFYEPEAAIEAAAQLQLMGGDIAQAFGDPFETMYLARNKPEELAKKLETMTENMVSFNEETGQYDLPAEARQQLQFAAEQLGVSKDNMIDLAIQSSKIKDIKMDVSGNITDDDMRETLAGMAQMKDGRWVVDVGEAEPIDIADITEEQAKKISATPEQTMREQALATQTNTQALENNTQALKDEIVRTVPIYETTSAAFKQPLQEFNQGVGKLITTFKSSKVGSLVTESPEKIGELFGKGLSSMINDGMATANTGLESILSKLDPITDTISNFDLESLNKVLEKYGSTSTNTPIINNSNTNNNLANSINNKNYTEMINTTMSNLKDINVDGKIDFSEIKVVLDNSSDKIQLSEKDKNEIIKAIHRQILQGGNSIITGGKITGKDALIGT
jgi:hypothetical protein